MRHKRPPQETTATTAQNKNASFSEVMPGFGQSVSFLCCLLQAQGIRNSYWDNNCGSENVMVNL